MDRTGPDDPARRTLLGAATAGAIALVGAARAQTAAPRRALVSPPTTPYLVPLPVYGAKAAVVALTPPAGRVASGLEAGRAPHQRSTEFYPRRLYELHVKAAPHSFHPELPVQTVWGYDGLLPGPTFAARYGEPVVVRIFNELPGNHVGTGSPEISTHLHNAHTASESDGFPGDYYSPAKAGPTLTRPGPYKDHLYPNCYAGFDQYRATGGDPREALGTLWYHDQRVDFAAQNTYRGLAGFYLLFDDIDSGNENDSNPQALRLPSGIGEYDIPLLIADLQFDSGGYLAFDQFDTEDFVGDKVAVNGKLQPYFKVQRRKYRFRLLNASLSRIYDLEFSANGLAQPFLYIANDGNLLPAPLDMSSVQLAPGERADVVIDFAMFPLGATLVLENRVEQRSGRRPSGREPTGRRLTAPTALMRIDVDTEPPVPDASQVPDLLRALAPINPAEAVRVRTFRFDRIKNVWTINGKVFDIDEPALRVKRESAEIWVFKGGGERRHTLHLHFEEARILSRNGAPPPPHERGRKDVFVVRQGEEVRIFVRFRDFVGKYILHCPNLAHEGHGMMLRFDIEP